MRRTIYCLLLILVAGVASSETPGTVNITGIPEFNMFNERPDYALHRTELPEDGYRVFKIGPRRHYWMSCATHSMDPTLNCNMTYWAYSAGYKHGWKLDVRIGDVVAYRIPKEWRDNYRTEHGVRIRYFIHRIVEQDGPCWYAQGDNNPLIDPICVTDDMIRYIVLWEEPEPWRISIRR